MGACFVTLMVVAPASQAAFAGANGKVAFTHYASSAAQAQIYTIGPDGTGRTPLTSGPANNFEPAWSPDGKKIVFSSTRDEPNPGSCGAACNTEIYVMDSDGANQTRLTNDASADGSPQWSPDGTKIVFGSDRTGGGDIYSMNADGTGVVRITTSPSRDADPSWSPDGAKIAFTAENTILRLMNPDGTNQTTVAGDSGLDVYAPDWSPDATTIAYQEHSCCDSNDNTMEVHTVHRDGTGDLFLGYNSTAPAWSPNGSRIAIADQECRYVGDTNFCTSKDIVTMNPDGSGRVNLTNNPSGVGSSEPSWQPISYTGYPRPRGATLLTVPLVPAYKQCTTSNRTHGAPLAYPSCNPPQQLGPFTTLGTPDANGAGAKSVGLVRLQATTGDVRLAVAISDVRCLPAESATVCNGANSADGPDYSGPMLLDILFRVTDHGSGSGGGEAATMVDLPLASLNDFQITCQNTTDTTIGGQCGMVTTYNAGVPGAVAAGKRTIWEVGQIIVDQLSGPSGHEHGYTFLKGGLFVP